MNVPSDRTASSGSWADYITAHDPGDPGLEAPRAFSRLLARVVDYALFVIIVYIGLFSLVGAWNPFRAWGMAAAAVWIPLAWIPFEALLLTSAATTPGRHLLGIRVEASDGDPPYLGTAFRRSLRVWAEGIACGIPVLSLLAVIRAGLILNGNGITPWDRRASLHVRHRPPKRGRALASAFTILLILSISGWFVSSVGTARYAKSSVERIVDEIGAWAEEEGSDILVEGELEGALNMGEEHRIPVTLEPGETWAAAVACDEGCYDIDLYLVSESGDTLASDARAFEEASLFFETHRFLAADLVVYMYSCDFGPCAYAVRLLELDAGLTAGRGTCFGVAPGVLVTARHVVGERDSVFVQFGDGPLGVARVDPRHWDSDVALLTVEDTEHGVLPLATGASQYAGAIVLALGYPATDVLGDELKVTDGVVSALTGPEENEDLLQTSAPIQPGNSGGPLVNEKGEVVGMVVSTARSDAFYFEIGELPQNVNWAVRSEIVADILADAGIPIGRSSPATSPRSAAPSSQSASAPATDRRTALERAIAATCMVQAQ